MNRIMPAVFGLAITMLFGCASAPDPLEVSEVETLEATVVAVDAEARTLVLRGPQGNDLALTVGPEVRNLAQVQVGDTLTVDYYTGFLFSIAEPGQAGGDFEIVADRAEEGARPGAVVGAAMTGTVEILSVAQDGTAVTFRDARGRTQSIEVAREEGQAFARKLRRGDLVDIQYSETVAIDVAPADSGD